MVWKRLLLIYRGWKNLAFKDPLVEKIAKDRALTCAKCEFMTTRASCQICGCPLAAKTRSLADACPVRKWGPRNPQGELTG